MTGTEVKEGPGRASSGPSRATRDGEATGRNRGRTSNPRQNALENTGGNGIVGMPRSALYYQREGGIYVRICVAKPLNLSVGPLNG